MEKLTIWTQQRKNEILLVWKYWLPIIKDSIISSLSWWAGALGLSFLATLVALIITYKKQGTIEINDFFPPNFGWGILIGLVAIFFYQVVIEAAKYMNESAVEAEKYNWDHVTFDIEKYSILGLSGWGINIGNKKETTLCVSAWLAQVREGQKTTAKDRVWLLGHVWKEKDMLNLGYARIKKGESEIFAVTTKATQGASFYIETHGGRIDIPEDFVVDVNIEANFENPNPFWIPILFHLSIKVNLDGTISIRDFDGRLEEKQKKEKSFR